jgi:hypothetical protein
MMSILLTPEVLANTGTEWRVDDPDPAFGRRFASWVTPHVRTPVSVRHFATRSRCTLGREVIRDEPLSNHEPPPPGIGAAAGVR